MNTKKLLALWGLKWNPFSPELPGEGLLVTPRIEHFAWRVEQLVQEGGFALITGESGTGKIGGAADRRRAALGAAGRHGRRDRAAPVEDRRLLSRAGRHLRGEAHAVQSLGRIQGAPRALEGPRGLVTDPAGAPDRRSPGDEPRGPRRAADPLQCRLRCHVAVDGGPLGRRAAPGTVAAGGSRAAGDPDPHATGDRGGLARGAARVAPPCAGEGRQRRRS